MTRCHRLGPKSPGPRARPRSIIIKFHYYPDKETVWKAKKNLAKQNIWVREDFPQEIMEKRRVLEPIARKARDLGKRASVKYGYALARRSYRQAGPGAHAPKGITAS